MPDGNDELGEGIVMADDKREKELVKVDKNTIWEISFNLEKDIFKEQAAICCCECERYMKKLMGLHDEQRD